MDFVSLMRQIERPYWSPVHPSKYIIGEYRRQGWGVVYPQDIGAFNLMWVMSGVGLPPDSYVRFTDSATWVIGYSHLPLGRYELKDAAALMPLEKFARLPRLNDYPVLQPLRDALRLRV